MDEELDYTSSSPLLRPTTPTTKPEDEAQLPTLKRVQIMLHEQIKSYSSIDRLTVSEADLTVQQQLAVNKAVQAELAAVAALVDGVITDIMEKYNG